MKVIAFILACSMLFVNTENILESMRYAADAASMECCGDEGSCCCHTEDRDHPVNREADQDKTCGDDTGCTTGCHCSSRVHFSALAYDFVELDGITVRTYQYGNYLNTYSFEYFSDFLQPPREA